MPKATAIFDADDSRFQNAISRIDKKLRDLQAKFATLMKVTAEAMALPVAAWAAMSAGIASAIEKGKDWEIMAEKAGTSAGHFYMVAKGFKAVGMEASSAIEPLQKMQEAIISGNADGVISNMGVNLDALKKQTPTAQFNALGVAINRLPDAAERIEAAKAIFGKAGGDLLAVFANKGFGAGGDKLTAQAQILERDAKLFEATSQSLHRTGVDVEGFFLGVADKVVPVLKPLLDRFAKMDLSKYGQQIGKIMGVLVESFADGNLWSIVSTSGIIALKSVGNAFFGMLNASAEAIIPTLIAAGKALVSICQIMCTSDFWKGMWNALLAAGSAFTALMLRGVAEILDQLAKIPGLAGVASKAAGSVRNEAGAFDREAKKDLSIAGTDLGPAYAKITADLGEALKEAAVAAIAGYKSGSNVFDATGDGAKLAALISKVMGDYASVSAKTLAENQAPGSVPGGPDLGQAENKGKKTPTPVSHLQSIGASAGWGGLIPVDIDKTLAKVGGGVGGAGNAPGAPKDPLLSAVNGSNDLLRRIYDRLALLNTLNTARVAPAAAYG